MKVLVHLCTNQLIHDRISSSISSGSKTLYYLSCWFLGKHHTLVHAVIKIPEQIHAARTCMATFKLFILRDTSSFCDCVTVFKLSFWCEIPISASVLSLKLSLAARAQKFTFSAHMPCILQRGFQLFQACDCAIIGKFSLYGIQSEHHVASGFSDIKFVQECCFY